MRVDTISFHSQSDTREATHTPEHQPPVQPTNATAIGHILERNIHHVAQHDPERRPRLEHHDEGPTDERWRTLCRVHRYRRTLWAKSESEEEPRHEEMRPGVGDALPDAGDEGEYAGNEDRAPAAK